MRSVARAYRLWKWCAVTAWCPAPVCLARIHVDTDLREAREVMQQPVARLLRDRVRVDESALAVHEHLCVGPKLMPHPADANVRVLLHPLGSSRRCVALRRRAPP